MNITQDAYDTLEAELCDVLTLKEYAAMFRISVRSVQYAINEGCFPYEVIKPTGARAQKILVPCSLLRKIAHDAPDAQKVS